jgi:hypothetical protein
MRIILDILFSTPVVRHINTLFFLLVKKAPLMALLYWQVQTWTAIPDGAEVPFASARYSLMVMNGGAILIPLARWFLFPAAAYYAEQGGLAKDLSDKRLTATDNLKHYWFATAVSTLIVAAAFFLKA